MLKFFLLRLLGGILVTLVAISAAGYWLYTEGLNTPLPVPTSGMQYTVQRGANLSNVALDLAQQKLLTYPVAVVWVIAARYHGQARQIKAGEFAIPSGTTPNQLLAIFIHGKVIEYPITFLEGWTFAQMRGLLQSQEKLTHTLTNLADADIMAALGRPGVHPEGQFFPDTYHIPAGTEDLQVLRMALEKMERELNAAWAEREIPSFLTSPEQALILASIIEKETALDQERAQVSGVFTRRLQQGMRLQTDPCVIYGLGAEFDGNLRSADLKRDTPYNTYTRAGLPPTPIAMPGRASLRAALNPAAGEALFFVATNDGGHVFSATLSEHQCAVMRYQLRPHAPARFRAQCRIHPHCAVCQEP